MITATPRGMPLLERILASVVTESRGYHTPCWIWQKCVKPTAEGYGYMRVGGRQGRDRRVHQVAYEQFVGPIPEGLQIDHLCRVHTCCNPEHLEPVTNQENGRRGIAGQNLARWQAAKTHCPQRHSYSGANLYTDRKGKRHCRECRRQECRRRRARRKARLAVSERTPR